jgi:hypothetical protein
MSITCRLGCGLNTSNSAISTLHIHIGNATLALYWHCTFVLIYATTVDVFRHGYMIRPADGGGGGCNVRAFASVSPFPRNRHTTGVSAARLCTARYEKNTRLFAICLFMYDTLLGPPHACALVPLSCTLKLLQNRYQPSPTPYLATEVYSCIKRGSTHIIIYQIPNRSRYKDPVRLFSYPRHDRLSPVMCSRLLRYNGTVVSVSDRVSSAAKIAVFRLSRS